MAIKVEEQREVLELLSHDEAKSGQHCSRNERGLEKILSTKNVKNNWVNAARTKKAPLTKKWIEKAK